MRVACLLLSQGKEDQFLGLAEACFRFTPQIAIRSGEAIFLDITKCKNLYTEEGLKRRVSRLALRFGWKAQIAIEKNAPTALAKARFGSDRVLPLEALLCYASPFATDEESRDRILRWMETLRLLGIKNLEQFLNIPPSALASRFGKSAVELSSRVRGHLVSAWPGFHPLEKISESVLLDETTIQLEPLIFLLKGVVDRAMARLKARAQRASVMEVRLDLEKWTTVSSHQVSWKMELALPQGSASALIPIIQEHLSRHLQREPLRAPVERVSFDVLETTPGAGAQRDFFSKKEEESEAWSALVGFLSQKLGKGKVFVAMPVDRYLPEKAWSKGLEFESESELGANAPHRPVRVLKKPEPLGKSGRTLVHLSGKRWNILRWEGPERLSSEWWSSGQGFHRDYYRIFTVSGEQLWVFLDRRNPAPVVYLHGYFD